MKLYTYNITQEKLNRSRFPVFIGISVGIKPMSEEIALSYFQWAEKHTSEVIQILIADEIAQFNYLACSHSTKPGALNRAIRDGDKYQIFFEKVLEKLTNKANFNLLRWKDIKNEKFHVILKQVILEFETNQEFREAIITIGNQYLNRRSKEIKKDKINFVYQYLLHELPTLLDGIYVNDKKYNLILYPTYKHSGMSALVCDIQNGIRFQSLRDKLKLEKTIMVEWLIRQDKEQKLIDNNYPYITIKHKAVRT